MRSVRDTLAALGLGLILQRLAQLLALLALARTLGREATGIHAQGIAFGGVLAVLATAGLRNHVARAISRTPAAAGPWLWAAVRVRLLRGVVLSAAASALAFACSDSPWFWILCALQTLPAAFDLKHLGDAVARTRTEVTLETTASVGFLAAVVAWLVGGGTDLAILAAIHLGCRTCYAAGAACTIAAMPATVRGPTVRDLLRQSRRLAPAQIAGDLCIAADVWLVARLAGDGAAGLYAVAARIAGAAGIPSAQLARLFFPHQLRAAHAGDAVRTARVALRATALVLLPILGGGAVVADDVCLLFGPGFAAAAWPLRWLLLAIAAQHLGWQAHQTLLAAGRDREFAAALWLPAALHACGLLVLAPLLGASGGAFATGSAQLAFLACTLLSLGSGVLLPLRWALAPVLLAVATTAAALVASWMGAHPPLLLPLATGALVWVSGIYLSEFRKRWRRIGSGLAEASGFR